MWWNSIIELCEFLIKKWNSQIKTRQLEIYVIELRIIGWNEIKNVTKIRQIVIAYFIWIIKNRKMHYISKVVESTYLKF